MSESINQQIPSLENRERGENVEIVLKFIRHGERDTSGNLTDYGREITRQRAQESGIQKDEFDAVKAIGSTAGPKSESGMPRSLETAHIYAKEIEGDEAFKTRARDILSYESYISPRPYDHVKIYNANLPDNFEQLSDQDKAIAAKKAQAAVINYLLHLDSQKAIDYKREIAGSFSYVIDHYQQMARRLNSGSRVLLPAGTHGGTMEFLLQQALVRKDKDGNEKIGFEDIAEIGGEFDPSEAFNVSIETDEKGEDKKIKVTFDNPQRPQAEEAFLDPHKIRELKDFYLQLHDRDKKSSV